MKLQYVKLDPCGNTTALILDAVEPRQIPAVAAAVMGERSLGVEQVGFLQKPRERGALARMQMMGGEFCGNASRSFAAFLAMGGLCGLPYRHRPAAEGRQVLDIEVSGHDGLLSVEVEGNKTENGCFAAVDMPLPAGIVWADDARLGHYAMVRFEGITHFVLPEAAPDAALLDAARVILRAQGVEAMDLGLMFAKGDFTAITPLVAIEAVGSTVWESSCGSGSVATACALAARAGKSVENLALSQPGGRLSVSAELAGGRIVRTRLAGDISVASYGEVFI